MTSYIEMLESMSDPSISGFAVEMLHESSVRLQKIAARILEAHGNPEALDRLWTLYCEWSAVVEVHQKAGEEREVNFHDVVQVDKALGSCVREAPGWLEQAIRTADATTQPVHTLVFLIPKVEQGKELWHRIKKVVFEKVRPTHERSLAVCITYFLDREEVRWLEERVNRTDDLLAPMARKGLYILSPEGAFQLIAPEARFELALSRSWWLPPLQIEYPHKIAELLFETIRAAENPWQAASFYDGRENWLSAKTLDFLLETTNDLLDRELTTPGPENKDPLYRPFKRLSSISHPDLLKLLWERRGTDLERNLTAWLIREGPTDSRGRRLTPEAGLLVLRKIAGEGIFQLANAYLETATTYWGRDEAFDLALRASNDRTIELLTQVAFQEEEHPISSGTFPLDQRDALLALTDWGYNTIVVRGVVRWGLQMPPDFDAHLRDRALGDAELASAVEALSLDPVPPGAVLSLGMSSRPEMEGIILSLLDRVEPASQQALACLLALEMLGTQSEASEQAFLRAREFAHHGFVVRRALDRFEARRATQESRTEAAKRVWEQRHDLCSLFEENASLESLAYLDNEEVREYLHEQALSETSWGGEPSANFDAVRALMKLDPESAFEAARHQIARGSKEYRKLYPKPLLETNRARAEVELANLLREDEDIVLIHSIGEALDQTSYRPLLLRWLSDSDPRLRQGACLAAEAMRWSPDLDEALFALRRDEDWDTREAAWQALEQVRLQKEVDRLITMFQTEADRARRWSVLDAALDLGYPGVVEGYGRLGWFAVLQETEGIPYSMRKYALKRLKERREVLIKDLKKRERD